MATACATIEYLATTKIGEKGQLTVPKGFREEMGLGSGSPFAVLRLGDGLILLPEQKRFEHFCERLSAALTSAGVTEKALLATLPEARAQVYERRYGARAATSAPKKKPPQAAAKASTARRRK